VTVTDASGQLGYLDTWICSGEKVGYEFPVPDPIVGGVLCGSTGTIQIPGFNSAEFGYEFVYVQNTTTGFIIAQSLVQNQQAITFSNLPPGNYNVVYCMGNTCARSLGWMYADQRILI
jgi:hypothetical protein